VLRGCIRKSKSGCDEGGERVVRREGVGGAADEGELGGGEARAARDRPVVDPLVLCVAVCRDPQDNGFADVGWKGALCADGAEEGVPAICDMWGVEEGGVEWGKASVTSSLSDSVCDWTRAMSTWYSDHN